MAYWAHKLEVVPYPGEPLLGCVSGMLVGYLVGDMLGQNDDPFFGSWYELDAQLGGMAVGALIGTAAGVALGSLKIKFPINGSQQRFITSKMQLQKYAYPTLPQYSF